MRSTSVSAAASSYTRVVGTGLVYAGAGQTSKTSFYITIPLAFARSDWPPSQQEAGDRTRTREHWEELGREEEQD